MMGSGDSVDQGKTSCVAHMVPNLPQNFKVLKEYRFSVHAGGVLDISSSSDLQIESLGCFSPIL